MGPLPRRRPWRLAALIVEGEQGAHPVTEPKIVRFAEVVAGELARTYAGAPLDELRVWVRVAHRREAMVTELYRLSDIEARLGALDPGGVAPVLRAAVSSIWAHEESHTRFLGALRSLSESLPGITELQGRLEGLVTRSAVSGGLLARALIAVGASLGGVPAFARDLREMSLRELVLFHAELETTARMGYARILTLLRELSPAARQELEGAFGLTFDLDLARIHGEESFHEDAFRLMAGWVATDGQSLVELPRLECVRILHDVCERDLSVDAVARGLRAYDPNEPISKGDGSPPFAASSGWVSDGGLGALFSEYALPVPLLPQDAVASRLRATTGGAR